MGAMVVMEKGRGDYREGEESWWSVAIIEEGGREIGRCWVERERGRERSMIKFSVWVFLLD